MQHSRAEARDGAETRRLAWIYAVGSSVGFVASFTLLIEKIALLEDPSYVPTCSVSPILNCGSIMRTGQAEVFGFPNPILGITGFAIIGTVGVALLAGARLARWFWWAMLAGSTAGILFVHWLIIQSIYRIGALCPYCMVVWVVMIVIFWYTALSVLVSDRTTTRSQSRGIVSSLGEYHGVVLTAWYLLIAALITERFWSYWRSLL